MSGLGTATGAVRVRSGAIGRRSFAGVTLYLLAAACGDRRWTGLELRYLPEIGDAIGAVRRDGGQKVVSEIVDVDFDELLVFPMMSRAEHVNEAAGTELVTGAYYTSSAQLFLFRRAGAAVLAAMVTADTLDHEVMNASFGPDVQLEGPGGGELITLRDGEEE